MNILMGDSRSENILPSSDIRELVVDTETLVSQTQNRMWRALRGNYRYDLCYLKQKYNVSIPR
jgi:hypothetical protein